MQSFEKRAFDVQELKEYFFTDRQPVEQFDVEQVRQQLEQLLQLDSAR